ncbi:MAG: 2-C-methyl-D-erythritol 2,4-cyclodiphosphate synthase, partial [Candidatus Marinimicrobia bacterium]|nr:2-C-methyl-D-erythritol 2,4-cyclodiphosphate synthase [Candidatus Neomarinimicrobiota bacterium]
EMRDNISNAMNCDLNSISIKATTNEKLGTIGRGEGIAVFSVALLKKAEKK